MNNKSHQESTRKQRTPIPYERARGLDHGVFDTNLVGRVNSECLGLRLAWLGFRTLFIKASRKDSSKACTTVPSSLESYRSFGIHRIVGGRRKNLLEQQGIERLCWPMELFGARGPNSAAAVCGAYWALPGHTLRAKIIWNHNKNVGFSAAAIPQNKTS